MTNEELLNLQLTHRHAAQVFVALEPFDDGYTHVASVVAGTLQNKRAYLAWGGMLSLDKDKEGNPKLIPEEIREEVLSLRQDLKTGEKILKETHILPATAKQLA